ncbi:M6 family metalloprotease domain-containing protein [Aliikangiella sp. G2MR2-5]|uniref:M6 family metalloprotease domain-containing protein n=1 Tax=Aliikangiella sp. G2MR2-5 TaxID=2788943 RepID=UPI0018ABE16D|nr:M6 family metalloprotease domain-containing protein [Aliikangiella sp. G2MR2-5]
MKIKTKLSILAGAIGLSAQVAFMPLGHAIPANPNPVFDTQPDGSVVQIRVKGDEHFNWNEDQNGYTIIRHKGWYKYAKLNSKGALVASEHIVGKANPKALGLQKRLLPAAKVQAKSSKRVESSTSIQGITPSGAVKNLVVMIRFANHTGRSLPSVADVDVLFNAVGGDATLAPTGSVRDVYLKNSYNQMELNSDVQPWITVSNTEAYYANGQSGDQTLWEALREALSELDKTVDFRDYDSDGDGKIDAIAFLHSGYGAEWGGTDVDGTSSADRIWSHRWSMQSQAWTSEEGVTVNDYHISPALWSTSGSEIGRIGVIAHETGHFFGLPDLYDTNGGGAGIGSYGLMANSWDFQGTQYCPPHFSPWSKTQLGWYSPQEISASGEYSLRQSEQYPDVYKISQGFPSGEYLLVENRQNSEFDCTLPQGGLAIWHIDEQAGFNTEGYPGQARWPQNGNHYRVALLQADGAYDLEQAKNRGDAGDVYHGSVSNAIGEGPGGYPNTDTYQNGIVNQTGNSLTNISLSGSTMTFCLNGCGGSSGLMAPTNLTASVQTSGKGKNATKTVTLNWQDNSSNEDNFIIERCLESGKGKSKTCNFSPLATVGADSTSFSDVPGSGTFKYRVKATNSSEQSDYSNEVKI